MPAIRQSAFELTRGAIRVGVLVPENERALRLVVIDERYRLLDGSRFPNVRQAEMTVQRLSNVGDHPPTANAADGRPRRSASLCAGLSVRRVPYRLSGAQSIWGSPCPP